MGSGTSTGAPEEPPSSFIRDLASSSKRCSVEDIDAAVSAFRQQSVSNSALSSSASTSCRTPQSSTSRCPAHRSIFRLASKCIRVCPFSCCMETLPSALCWRIREPPFMRIRTILRSGYFTSVLELRPVSRCKEPSCRNWHSSPSRSISRIGPANPVNRSIRLHPRRADLHWDLEPLAPPCGQLVRSASAACHHRAGVRERHYAR